MRFLLDTHIFLWRILAPDRLSETQANLLDDLENELYLSPISVWETLVLARRGRLELRPDPESFVRTALAESPTVMAPFHHEIAIVSESLVGFDNPDPADRFLIATASVEALCLVTADERILRYPGIETVC